MKKEKKMLAFLMSIMIAFLGGCTSKKEENITYRKNFDDISISDDVEPNELLDYLKDYTFIDEQLEKENLSISNINESNIDEIISCILRALAKDLLVEEGIDEISKIEIDNDFINISYKNYENCANKYGSFYSDSHESDINKCYLLNGEDYTKLKKLLNNFDYNEAKKLISKTILSKVKIENNNFKLYVDKDKIEAVEDKKIIK